MRGDAAQGWIRPVLFASCFSNHASRLALSRLRARKGAILTAENSEFMMSSQVHTGQVHTGIAQRIQEKLQAALAPIALEVVDESHKHAGHAHVVKRAGTAQGSGETHFRVKVVAEVFKGKSRIDRHRTINGLLSAEFDDGVHALAIDAKAPGE
jgi:BolA family transcriptional regulator, general stress-responsive regulator